MTNNFRAIYSTYVQLKPKENIPQWKTLNNDKNPPNPNASTVRPLSETFDSSSNDEYKKSAPLRFQSSKRTGLKSREIPTLEDWNLVLGTEPFSRGQVSKPTGCQTWLRKTAPNQKGTDDRYSKNGKTHGILYCIFYQPIPVQRFFFLRLCRCNVWLQFLFYLFGCKSANMFMRVLSKNAWGMTDVVDACPCDLFPRVPIHKCRSSTNGVYPRIGEMLCLTRMKRPWRFWYDSATKSDKDGWA